MRLICATAVRFSPPENEAFEVPLLMALAASSGLAASLQEATMPFSTPAPPTPLKPYLVLHVHGGLCADLCDASLLIVVTVGRRICGTIFVLA